MPYANSAAISRPEISAFLEEARHVEEYFIADQIFPIIPVESKAGRYPRINKRAGNLLKAESTERAPTGSYNEIARKFEWDTFKCKDRGLKERIDDVVAEEMGRFFDAEQITSRLLMRANLLDYERRVATEVLSTSNFTGPTAATAAYTEANIETIDFAKDFFEAEDTLRMRGVVPNTMVINRKVWNRLRRSGRLQTYLYGKLGLGASDPGHRLIEATDLAAAFNLAKVYIASATYDSAPVGAATNIVDIWSTSHIWLGEVQTGDFSLGGAGRTLVWGADVPGGMWASETWRDEERRGDMVRVRTHSTEKVVDENCGQLIATSYA